VTLLPSLLVFVVTELGNPRDETGVVYNGIVDHLLTVIHTIHDVFLSHNLAIYTLNFTAHDIKNCKCIN
jgi:hypothetical protein